MMRASPRTQWASPKLTTMPRNIRTWKNSVCGSFRSPPMAPPSLGSLGSFDGKRQNFVDVARAGCKHDQTIEADRDAGAIRQPGFERAEEQLVHRIGGQAAALAF